MGETRRTLDADFREGAVRLVRETGKPIAQVARHLGIILGAGLIHAFDLHALRLVPDPGAARRLRIRRIRMPIRHRLKLSGMRWIENGATGILTPALPRSQQPVGANMAAHQPDPRSLTARSATAPHSDRPGQRNLLASHLHRRLTPRSPQIARPARRCRAARPGTAPPRRRGKRGALGGARGGEGRRARPPGSRGRQVTGLRRCRPGGGRGGAAGRAAEARRRGARGGAVDGPRLPRAARGLRARSRCGVHRLPGEGHRHCPRAGHPAAGLVQLRPLRARLRPARRGTGRGGAVDVTGPGRR